MVSLLFVCSFACFSFSCAGSPSLVHCTETCFQFCLVRFAYVLVLCVGSCFGFGRVYYFLGPTFLCGGFLFLGLGGLNIFCVWGFFVLRLGGV